MGNNVDLKRQGHGDIIGGFGNKFASLYYRCNTIETGLNDIRSANRIFDILCCDGALRLNLPDTKSAARYLVDSAALVFLTTIRGPILRRKKTRRVRRTLG